MAKSDNSLISEHELEAELSRTASLIRTGIGMSVGGIALVVVALLILDFGLLANAPQTWLLRFWFSWLWAMVIMAISGLAWVHFRKPSEARLTSLWIPTAQVTQIGLNFGIAAAPWVLLSEGNGDMQWIVVIMYLWYIAVFIITSSVGAQITIFEVVMLSISIAVFLAQSDIPLRYQTSGLALLIGLSMLALRKLWQSVMIKAVDAQVRAISAEAKTRAALLSVSADRDAKRRFIASASHDLQQPLLAASHYCDLIVREDRAAIRREISADADMAFGAMRSMINDMVLFLKLEAQAQPYAPRTIPVVPRMQAAAKRFSPEATKAGITIKVAAPAAEIVADPVLLDRILDNLVSNAIRHSGADRILLTARRRRARLEIYVIDNGIGLANIPDERLFTEFATGSIATAGFGIGLANVRMLAELMGGSAEVDVCWRAGAAFRIRLPVSISATLDVVPSPLSHDSAPVHHVAQARCL